MNAASAHRPTNRQNGIALLTAIFILVLATIAATALATSASVALRRASNLQESELAWWYAEGTESWVRSVLQRDAQANKTDSLADAWAQPVAFIPIDNGGIRGQVIDLQGLFNLNSLGAQKPEKAMAQFQRLLQNIPNLDPGEASGVADAIRDWIDADSERSGANGAEDGDYLSLDPPYRAANQPFHSVSELLAVRSMTPKLYDHLRPYVCALPAVTSINVNTAPLPVLMSLGPEMSAQKLQGFIETRTKNPADTVEELKKDGTLPQDLGGVEVGVTSHWFELHGEVVVGSARVALYSVIYRPDGGGVPLVMAHSTDSD